MCIVGMGKVKKQVNLKPGDLIVSLDDTEVGLLVERKKVGGLLKGSAPSTWAWNIEWVKGGARAKNMWNIPSVLNHSEEDLIEDILSGYWSLYRGVD